MAEFIICTAAKPEKLSAIVGPVIKGSNVNVTVLTPQEFQNADLKPGTLILLMGAPAYKFLVDEGIVNKKLKLGSAREKIFLANGFPVLVSYDPGMVDFMPEIKPDIIWDVRLAIRYATTGTLNPVVGDYHYVEAFDEIMLWAAGLDKTQLTPLAFDTETIGLDEFAPEGQIITVQLSYKVGHALVYKSDQGEFSHTVKTQLTWLFSCPWLNTIGANLKYDMRWMAHKKQIYIRNNHFDTQLAGGSVNENRYNSLKKHCKEYAPTLGGYEEEFEAKWDKARMDLALAADPGGFLQYSGGDTDAALRIYPPIRAEILKDAALSRFYVKLLHPASIAFRQLETRGIVIDKPRYLELKVQAEAERDEISAKCFSMMPNKIKYKYSDNLSLTRDVIIVDFLFGGYGLKLKPTMATPKGMITDPITQEEFIKVPSTAWIHLKQFIDHPEAGPFVKLLKQYNATCKTVDTYIVGFLVHLRSDGRFHSSYVLAKGGQAGDEDEGGGTLTGRSSCRDPAYQTWPKRTAWAKRLRSVVICPPGYVIVKLDYSQGELRIMADASNCKNMILAYHQGLDLHAITAAKFMNLTMEQFLTLPKEEIDKARDGAKAGNFGLIYRISPEGYMAFAESSYNVKLSLKQAEENHAAFFKLYPEIEDYHDDQVSFARKNGYVRNQLGAVRHLPLIKTFDNKTRGKQERQAINSPTQGCLFQMMMLLMIQIHRERPDVWMFGNTHDSLEMYLKQDTWEADCHQIKQMAENLPLHEFGWKPKVPFLVDFEMGAVNLGDMKKVKIT